MPTEMVGQNGLVIKQNTKIAVTGCPKFRHERKKAARKGAKKQDGRRAARRSGSHDARSPRPEIALGRGDRPYLLAA